MKSILILDDNEDILFILQTIISQGNFQVITTNNTEKARELAKQHQIDCLITDIVMPQESGISVLLAIKEMLPDVKIIAISGGDRNNPEDYLPKAKDLGADATLAKPFQSDKILDLLDRLLA